MSFDKKIIRTTITMAKGYFAGNDNTFISENFPTRAFVSKPGGADHNKLTLEIMNMTLSKMEQLTVLGFRPLQSFNNIISVDAGNENDLATCFTGEITKAFARFNNDGIATFVVEAMEGSYPLKLATPGTSVVESVQISQLMQKFANEAGYAFQNMGISGSVGNSVFVGDPITKAKMLEKQAGIKLLIDNRTFIIMPRQASRTGTVPELSKESGLLKYPEFNNDGISLTALYDKAFQLEGLIKVKSIVPKASGVWRITKLENALEAGFSNARSWFTNINAAWVQE